MRSRSARAPALALALAIAAAACSGGQKAQPSAPTASPTPATYHFHGRGTAAKPVKVIDTEAGQPVYVLKATDVYYSTSSSKGRFFNNTIYFYKGSAVRMTVTAPTADVNRLTYDFDLSGGVRAKSAQGVVLTCDAMSYNGQTRLLTGTGHVRAIDAQGDVVTGDKAVADLDLQEIHMTGDVGIGRRH